MKRRALLALTLAYALLGGCDRGAGPNTPSGPRERGPGASLAPLVIVGLDGWEWDVGLPLLRAGRLPALEGLMGRGQYGLLETISPTMSPVIWTTVATGKPMEQHGILDFVKRPKDGPPVLFQAGDRQTKALWNIASDYGLSVAVVGWWITFPCEPVNGLMVSQTNTFAGDAGEGDGLLKGRLIRGAAGQVWPAARQDEMMALLDRSEAGFPALLDRIFGAFQHPLTLAQQRNWDGTQWSFRADAMYFEIARELLAERPLPDLTMLYFGGPDVVGHRFWWYLHPEQFKQKPAQRGIDNFEGVIPSYYEHTDRMLAALLAAAPPETNWLLVSDHGMQAQEPPRSFLSAAHHNRPPGMLVAAGPAFAAVPERDLRALQRTDMKVLGGVLDIAPTVLAGVRVPAGRDMTGGVLRDLFAADFDVAAQPPAVATHDTPEFLAQRATLMQSQGDAQQRIEQLRGLGYLGGSGDDDADDDEGEDADAAASQPAGATQPARAP